MSKLMNTQVILKSRPEGQPEAEHFDFKQVPVTELADGLVRCKTRYLSLDPYMRSQISGRHISQAINPGDVLQGETISDVIASNHQDFKVGDVVRGFGGWQQFADLPASALVKVAHPHQSYALSVLGMPGLTAYAGLMWQAQPKPGDVVVVPAAIGGVGATVGQLAKANGCTVIGIAGSDEKCQIAVDKLGYHHCINRKTEDVAAQLDKLCPNGIDIYFDLVGGDMLHTASHRLAIGARVILCGLIAEYNQTERSFGPEPAYWIKARATVHGLVVYDFEPRRQEFIDACMPLIESGQLHMLEDISEGIDAAPEAFAKLMRGENVGKTLVKVS
ncbi:NADP-dependent oxidoreductase [Thalassotalea sp. HSM 43]|uniref:NADP-dependent oxidoreductase n=1 Tax=Thalassotalea sp. HSM 43 TaxID=2552945 RepID=UPI0010817188|nr:NADP-dependent oxidoreductase [Thalassotalea sp. HSM 43]QBY04592.1 NADP-dependent oxidoreductase [Thalassotalea sp. HSM 43]